MNSQFLCAVFGAIPRVQSGSKAVLVVVMLAILGACGGGDEGVLNTTSTGDGNPGTSTGTGTAPSPNPSPTPAPATSPALLADQPYTTSDVWPMDANGSINDPADTVAITHHTITLNGKVISYTASVGQMTIRAPFTSTPLAKISYIAFTKDGTTAESRPVTFVVGDGLGDSSGTIMLKGFGPRIIHAGQNGNELIDNPNTLLDDSDLVFVNSIGTGYSVALTGKTNRDYWLQENDATSISQFIARYLTTKGRLNSPKFFVADGIGVNRAARATYQLRADQGVAINGVGLISPSWVPTLPPSMERTATRQISPARLYPTIAMTARYHGRLPLSQQTLQQDDFLASVIKYDDTTFGDGVVGLLPSPYPTSNTLLSSFVQTIGDTTGFKFSSNTKSIASVTSQYDTAFGTMTGISKNVLAPIGGAVSLRDTRKMFVDGDYDLERVESVDMENYIRKELKYNVGSKFVISNSELLDYFSSMSAADLSSNLQKFSAGLRDTILMSSTLRTLVVDGYYDGMSPFHGTDVEVKSWELPADYAKTVTQIVDETGHSPELNEEYRPQIVASLRGLYHSTLVAMKLLEK